jgi:hypothetical protein
MKQLSRWIIARMTEFSEIGHVAKLTSLHRWRLVI